MPDDLVTLATMDAIRKKCEVERAALQQENGELRAALRASEAELAMVRDRLAELADELAEIAGTE